MVDNAALITALYALTTMITTMRAPATPLPIFNPFSEDQPFNLATYLGAQAVADVCEELKEPLDSSVFFSIFCG